MQPKDFVHSQYGQPARRPGDKWGYWYYSPKPIPRRLELSAALISQLSEADAALGRLAGLGHLITDPGALIGPLLTREALASSRIEGTVASLSEVLQAEATDAEVEESDDVREVGRYLSASREAFALIEDLPISQRLILKVHETLLSGVRGEEKNPGEFRKTPVWVGKSIDTPDTAVFVPPLPDEIPNLIRDWENFVNEPSEIPVLIQCALMHYQFETIHPFLDGNGRIGRLLISLLLKERGRLDLPLLYLSNYFENNRSDYYSALQGVRESGDMDTWVSMFLVAVRQQSMDAVRRAQDLVALRERYIQEASTARSSLPRLIAIVMSNPFVTVKSVERATNLSVQGSRNLIRSAVEKGWLTELGARGRGGREHWVAHEVLGILEAPFSYDSGA